MSDHHTQQGNQYTAIACSGVLVLGRVLLAMNMRKL